MTAATITPEPTEAEGPAPATPDELAAVARERDAVEAEALTLVQPADAVTEDQTGGHVTMQVAGYGLLTFSASQKRMSSDQRAALAAINIDPDADPQVIPHILPFMHMCQSRGLDPWKREAYLIGRGQKKTEWRKFTMQVAIDGYLNMAKGTGRYKRTGMVLWTGQDDDDTSWWRDDRGIMRRVWWDQWPASRQHPGSSLVVVEHYDETGELTETPVVADWNMYAPYNPVYEGPQGSKRKKVGSDGKDVLVLGEFWDKGGPYMLSKCGLALAVRRAFPGATAGTYLHDEMHQADAAEARRLADEQREKRLAAVGRSRPANVPAIAAAEPAQDADGTMEAVLASPSAPMVAPVEGVIVGHEEQPAARGPLGTSFGEDATDEQRREWLLAELTMMCEVIGTTVPALTRVWVAQHKKNADQASLAELQELVADKRPLVVMKLRQDEAGMAKADNYEQIEADTCGPVWWLLGLPESEQRDEQQNDGGDDQA